MSYKKLHTYLYYLDYLASCTIGILLFYVGIIEPEEPVIGVGVIGVINSVLSIIGMCMLYFKHEQ